MVLDAKPEPYPFLTIPWRIPRQPVTQANLPTDLRMLTYIRADPELHLRFSEPPLHDGKFMLGRGDELITDILVSSRMIGISRRHLRFGFCPEKGLVAVQLEDNTVNGMDIEYDTVDGCGRRQHVEPKDRRWWPIPNGETLKINLWAGFKPFGAGELFMYKLELTAPDHSAHAEVYEKQRDQFLGARDPRDFANLATMMENGMEL